jgi:hypothetical protein
MLDLRFLLLGWVPSVWWCLVDGVVSVFLFSSWPHVIMEPCLPLVVWAVICIGCLLLGPYDFQYLAPFYLYLCVALGEGCSSWWILWFNHG